MRKVVDIVMASVGVCSRITDAEADSAGHGSAHETDLIDGSAAAVLEGRAPAGEGDQQGGDAPAGGGGWGGGGGGVGGVPLLGLSKGGWAGGGGSRSWRRSLAGFALTW